MVGLSVVFLINFTKIDMFISLKNLYICVYVCVYDDFIALVVSGIVLARQCQGEVRPAQFVFFLKGKEILYPSLDFFFKINSLLALIMYMCTYL